MGDSLVILRMLADFFFGTRMTISGTTPTRDIKTKHGLRRTTNLYYTVILGATIHKENIGKE